ncbi:MAG: hypothetical protein KIS87_00230 [Phycisphaeraceae bacterium]|nr:hypothetical protein [Phycisphaeraceae bacterium]
MKRTRGLGAWGRFLVATIVAVAAAAAPAAGQGGDGPFTGLSLDDALELSKQQHRFLVVYPRGHVPAQPGSVTLAPGTTINTNSGESGFDKMDKYTWRSPTLRAWLEWHAITIRVDQVEHPQDWARLQELVPRHPVSGRPIGQEPVVMIFKDGRLFRTVPDKRFRNNKGGLPIVGDYDQGRFYIKPLQILLVADLAMSSLESTDPVWHTLHTMKNPPPQRPEIEPFHDVGSGQVAAVEDAPDAAPAIVLDRWREARERAALGGTAEATGLYTWLWERGRTLDPHAASAIRIVAIDEMRAHALRGGPAMERFAAMYRAQDRLAPWYDGSDMHDLILLAEAAHKQAHLLEYFSILMLQDDEGVDLEASVFSIVERAEIDLVTSRGRWSGLDEERPNAHAWLARQVGLLGARRPANAPADQWGELQTLRRRLIADEACRHHAAALLRGDEAAAIRFADLYLRAPRAEGDADPRLALAITALAADAVRPVHLAWIDEAAADGLDRPDLRAWAQRALGR